MIELNKVYCGDCLELMKNMPDNSVDLVITSPPYNVSNSNIECIIKSKYLNYDDDMNSSDYFEFISKRLNQMIRITRKYIFFNIQMLSGNKEVFLKIVSEYRNYLKDIIIWVKKNPPPNISPYVLSKAYEFILVFDKSDKSGAYNKDNNIKRCIPNAIIKTTNLDNRYADEHKAVFPNWLPLHFIKNFSDENDIVLDPFNGIGTVTYYAKMLNRQFIGIDIDKRYCEIANNRLNQTTFVERLKW